MPILPRQRDTPRQVATITSGRDGSRHVAGCRDGLRRAVDNPPEGRTAFATINA